MKISKISFALLLSILMTLTATLVPAAPMKDFENYKIDYSSPTNAELQKQIEGVDASLRAKYNIPAEETCVGVLDLQTLRLALIHPDKMQYAASVAKVGILLAYFELHPEAATNIDAKTKHELGMMAKISSNEMAAKYSHELTLKAIEKVLIEDHFYDTNHGGGIWMGKHYGKGTERVGDPMMNLSHAVTVRMMIRYFLELEQGNLVSPQASKTMREIFATPDLPHDDIKFVKGLAGRDVQIIRKWGSWENSLHDTAVITGPGRHYILVGLTQNAKGDDYLVDLAKAVDDLMIESSRTKN